MRIDTVDFIQGEIRIGVTILPDTGESFEEFSRDYFYDASWTKTQIQNHLQERLNEFKARYDRVQNAQDFVGIELTSSV